MTERMHFRWRIAQFFELCWWWRYLSGREKTAYFVWKKRYWQDFLRESSLDMPAGASVLDAGCGPAGVFTALENRRVDALDPLLDDYERTLPHFRRSDFPDVRFFCQLLENFFPEKKYDFVCCFNALNHVANLPRCVERLVALTKTGGTLAVSIDVHRYAWLKHLFRLAPADILHPHQYDLKEYRDMFAAHGFQPARVILMKKGLIFNYYLYISA